MGERTPRGIVGAVASAGGVEALQTFVAELDADADLGVLVVLHVPPTGVSALPEILERAGSLPAHHPADGERIRGGVILVAPPDHHLLVDGDVVRLDIGPRENGHRPSADLLLQSMARSWGRSAAGVVLSGSMDDGAAGLRAIRSTGGRALVQDPAEATFPGMPRAAIEEAEPHLVGPIADLVDDLRKWAIRLPDEHETKEAAMVPGERRGGGEVTPFTCPDCGGTLFMDDDFGAQRFRCRVGHAFSAESLLAGKRETLEATLWAGVVALRERADLFGRMALRSRDRGMSARAAQYAREEQASRQRADVLRGMVPDLVRETAGSYVSEEDDGDTAAGR